MHGDAIESAAREEGARNYHRVEPVTSLFPSFLPIYALHDTGEMARLRALRCGIGFFGMTMVRGGERALLVVVD